PLRLQLPSFFFRWHPPPRHLHSFPTRRSSDLTQVLLPRPLEGGCRWTASPPQNTRPLEYSVAYAWFTYQIDVLTISSSIVGSPIDRKSTRLNSSHDQISYAVFCLKKKRYNTLP